MPIPPLRDGPASPSSHPTIGSRTPTKASPQNPKKKRLIVAAIIVAALAIAAGWTPPARTVHRFTKASDYKAARESGCTNSGEGCHGTQTEYVDFVAYHPNTKCTVCHEYDGVGCIPCHKPRQHECAACHDGTMQGAADCVRLSDPYPKGHYRESSHTAMGTDMSRVVRSADGGQARARCKDCHSRGLRLAHLAVPVVPGSGYGPDVGCGECHNDTLSRGLAQVLANWPKRRCEDCHDLRSSSPMHSPRVAAGIQAGGPLGCGATGQGCHENNDLHALHPDKPLSCSGSARQGEPGCHDLNVESHEPSTTACGKGSRACHAAHVDDTFSHRQDRTVHSPKTAGPASDTSFEGIACGSCHAMTPDGTSLVVEHALATSNRSLAPDNDCRNCHNRSVSLEVIQNRWAPRDGEASCAVCHNGVGLDSPHERALASAHTLSQGSAGCAATGPGCHPTADLSVVGSPIEGAVHRGCLRCHDRTASNGNRSYDPASKTCGSGRDCHALAGEYVPATGRHRGEGEPTDGTDSTHHDAGAAQRLTLLRDDASGIAAACGKCHSMLLGVEHARPNNSLTYDNVCLGCHNHSDTTARIVKTDWPGVGTDDACAACHGSAASHDVPASRHWATQYDYRGKVSTVGCARAGCHATADVRILHKAEGCTVSGCHSGAGDIYGSRIMSCGGTDALIGSNCHTASGRHQEADQAHHATQYDEDNHVSETGCTHAGCHVTADVRTLHEADGCYTSGCHVEGGPTFMSCGGTDALIGSNCHTASNRHTGAELVHQATEYDRFGVPEVGACAKVGCHATVDVRDLHKADGCYTSGCHVEGGPTFMSCGGVQGQDNCHTGGDRHRNIDAAHQATELASSGIPEPGACAKADCHTTVDVRDLHTTKRCSTAGCHVEGGPNYMTCGGMPTDQSCHNPPPDPTCTASPVVPLEPEVMCTTDAETDATATAADGRTPAAGEPPADARAPTEPEEGSAETTSTPDVTQTVGGPPASDEDAPTTPQPGVGPGAAEERKKISDAPAQSAGCLSCHRLAQLTRRDGGKGEESHRPIQEGRQQGRQAASTLTQRGGRR